MLPCVLLLGHESSFTSIVRVPLVFSYESHNSGNVRLLFCLLGDLWTFERESCFVCLYTFNNLWLFVAAYGDYLYSECVSIALAYFDG